MRVNQVLEWLLSELNIRTVGYKYSSDGEPPFSFVYPNKNAYEAAHNPRMIIKDQKVVVAPYDGIRIPDAQLSKVLDIICNFNIDSVLLDDCSLRRLLPISTKKEREAAHCFFSLLHEIGHYIHFLSIKTEQDYVKFQNEYKLLKKQICFARDDMTQEQRFAEERKYKSLPGEREANSFAYRHIQILWPRFLAENRSQFICV